MKKITLLLFIILSSLLCIKAQDINNEDGVVKSDPLMSLGNCVPDEVLVKFKAGNEANVQRNRNQQVQTGIVAVDAVLAGYTFSDAAKLLPTKHVREPYVRPPVSQERIFPITI